ncbi:MAG: SurA N-terminal domain-containing protein [Betaproteobacteria bacterium]
MFDLVHKYRRVVQVILVLLVVPFAIWGVESYTSMRGSRDTVATVNGSEISLREFSEQYRVQQEQVKRLFGAQVDPAMLDSPQARRALLDSMIGQRLIAGEVAKNHLLMSREAVIEAITNAPEFQENGRFSPALYSGYLQSRGLSDAANVAQLQSQLPMSRFVAALTDTAIPSKSVASRIAALESQQREISEVRIPVTQFESQVKIDDAKLKAYYDVNQAEFQAPERVRAEYVVLSAEALAKGEPVSDEEVKKAYEARSAAYKVEEQRRARHILVKDRAEADKVAAEAKEAPNRFAELARKHSQDTASAGNGGDLGLVTRESLVSPKLAEAVFAMKQGDVQVVESEFGAHVVQVTAIQAGSARALEEVRGELVADLTRQKGQKKFAEAAETFSNMVYEQSDSLKPVAERFKLQVQTSGWIARSARADGVLDNPKLLGALFSGDSLRNKRNTDAVEVAPSTLVAARVVEHQPAAQRKFEEVKDEIARTLRQREASELAFKDGSAKLEKLKKGEDAGVAWSAPRMVSRRDAQGLPADILRRVVSADVSKLPAYLGIPIPDAGYLLVRIARVVEGEARDEAQAAQRVAGVMGAAEYDAYVAALRERADIQVNAATLEKK